MGLFVHPCQIKMGLLSTLTKFGLGLFVHPVEIHVNFCPVPVKACPLMGWHQRINQRWFTSPRQKARSHTGQLVAEPVIGKMF